MTQLLPCPFCGKPPAVKMTGFHLGARTIRCETHECMGPSTTAQNMDDATVQWNARFPKWECMGRKQTLPEPGDCNWPDCGCDEHATKVIESLLEQGWSAPVVLLQHRGGGDAG